jgi:hypothetical protein
MNGKNYRRIGANTRGVWKTPDDRVHVPDHRGKLTAHWGKHPDRPEHLPRRPLNQQFKIKKMNKKYLHFIPRTDAELARWALNYKTKIATLGLTVGLNAADITDQQDAAQVVIDAVNKVTEKKLEQEEAVTAKNMARENELQLLANCAVRIKRHSMFTENIGSELGIISSSVELVRLELSPALKLSVYPGSIEISFNKRRQQSVNIYARLNGVEEWEPLTHATSASPYIDSRPLTVAGKAEIREFRARCWDGNMEIGQHSDTVSALYGG